VVLAPASLGGTKSTTAMDQLQLVPTIRDLRPYPESPEARACGCPCAIARRRGKPLVTRSGMPVFAIEPRCPVHDNPDRELVIWEPRREQTPAMAGEEHCSSAPRPEPNVQPAADLRLQSNVADVNKKHLVKTLEEFQFSGASVDERLVREIHSGGFLDTASNILFTGGTGTGKTHLALSVAGEATRRGKHGYVFTAFDLVRKLECEFQGGAGSFLFDLAQADFVVVDELGYIPITPTGRALLYHLLARLDEKTSVIVTSHLPMTQWTQVFSDAAMTNALVDRFASRCHVVDTGTESWRTRIERTRQKLVRIGNLRETYSSERSSAAERASTMVASG
jgi:DNA replication protein DnaC